MTIQMRALFVHLFTATGAVLAMLAMLAAVEEKWDLMFLWLVIAFFVDGIDGPLARKFDVKTNAPEFDGVLMDLIIDYLTYVFIPAFALFKSGLMAGTIRALPHHQVMLVHDPVIAIEIGVGVFDLWDFADIGRYLPSGGIIPLAARFGDKARKVIRLCQHTAHCAGFVVGGGDADNALVAQLVIIGMGNDHGARLCGALGDDHRGAHMLILIRDGDLAVFAKPQNSGIVAVGDTKSSRK